MEKQIATERMFEGFVFSVRRDRVTLPDGREAEREVVEHSGGVAVVPVDEEGNITLVRQFRYACAQVLWEIPAGKLEKNEDHAACGLRELREETGLRCNRYDYLGYIYPSCGYDTEIIHLYLARELEQGEQDLDDGEFVEPVKISFIRAVEMIMCGEIVDAKTIAGILKAKEVLYGKEHTHCGG